MAKRTLAFVLGGGGARGALQVGALRALLEAGIRPDLLVGTSIGACNAVYIALNGVSIKSVDALAQVWRDAAVAGLLPPNYLWQTVRSLFQRTVNTHTEGRVRAFWEAHGITPDLRFSAIRDVRVVMVASDLNGGRTMLYGTSPEDSVLEATLASAALPPWIRPIENQGRLLIDGGFLSNLPIEAALAQGATEIVALDLTEPKPSRYATGTGLRPGVFKLSWSVQQRQVELEERLAAAHGVPVLKLGLHPSPSVPVWDFGRTEELMATGYEIAVAALAARQPATRTRFWTARDWLARSAERMAIRRKVA